jgi:ABC-2 type transport system permease protein
MGMSEVIALVRASWLSATSYRFSFVISLGALAVGIVPMYFVAGAIQPVVADSIRTEGGHYFGFLLVGLMTFWFLTSAVGSLPSALGSHIGSGTLEALLNTPARLPLLFLGLCSYPLLWTAARAGLMVVTGALLGATFAWTSFLLGFPVLLLIVLVHVPFALVSSAAVLIFRTPTPLNTAVLSLSMLLGGVYYSTSVIPSWMGNLSQFVPLTYGLRALRRLVLEDMPLSAVMGDLTVLILFGLGLWTVGLAAFVHGLRYARRAGTLSHY